MRPGSPRESSAMCQGEGKEQLVSYRSTGGMFSFSCWGVNTHSLYYVDIDTNALCRQDLTTGEETLLYTAPGPEEPEAELGVGDLWNYFAHGENWSLPMMWPYS